MTLKRSSSGIDMSRDSIRPCGDDKALWGCLRQKAAGNCAHVVCGIFHIDNSATVRCHAFLQGLAKDMNLQIHKLMMVLAVLAVAQLNSCSKKTGSEESGSASNNQPVGAKPFKGEVYRTFNGAKTITLTSDEELEISESGVNMICKYTKQDDNRLRVVANIMGTTQALYYRITPEGLQANDGLVLFSPSGLAQEKERLRIIAQRKDEESRKTAALLDASKKATVELSKFTLTAKSYLMYDYCILTDVSIKVRCSSEAWRYKKQYGIRNEVQEIPFANIERITALRHNYDIGAGDFVISWKNGQFPEGVQIGCSDDAAIKLVRDKLIAAYQEWGNKYPDFRRARFE